jgi:magnesium chelatase family protein
VALRRYARRISGPLLDRFDLRVRVEAVPTQELVDAKPGECSEAVAERVALARQAALARGVSANRELDLESLEAESRLTADARDVLDRALAHGRLSGRGMARLRAVALTLRDLAGEDPTVDAGIMQVAMGLRAEVGTQLAQVA